MLAVPVSQHFHGLGLFYADVVGESAFSVFIAQKQDFVTETVFGVLIAVILNRVDAAFDEYGQSHAFR